MHTLSALLFSAAVLTVSGRNKREWELVDLKKISRELLLPFYNYELSACSRGVGFYRDPNDCHQYIRCVDDYSTGQRLSIFVGRCRPGLVFDENISSCNWPDLAAPCNDSPERFKDTAGRFKPVQQDNAIPGISSGSQQERKQKPHDSSNQQFVQESEASVFQETEVQGQIQESFENSKTQVEKDRQQQIPGNSKSPKDRVQVAQSQQDYVRRQWPKPVNQRQQVQQQVRKPQEKPAHRPQQVREPVIQEQFERVQKPTVQKQENENKKREPVVQQQSEQVREPVVQEQFEQVRGPVIQEQFEQVPNPVAQQSEEIREPVIKQPEQIREPVIQQPEQIREPEIHHEHSREPVIQQQFEQVQKTVAQQTEQIRQPVVAQQFEQSKKPTIQQQFEPIQEPAIQEKEEIREPVIEESGKFPHDQPIWQQSDQQEKINQQSIHNQHPAFEENQQKKIQRPSNDNSQIKEQTQSSGFQEIEDEEILQIPTSSNNKPLQQQKQPTTQSNKWFQSNQSRRPVSSSGLTGSSRRRPVQALPTSLDYPILCRREGFFSHPRDCTRFVRCVRTEKRSFSVHFFQCANDLVFDEGVNHCVFSEGNTCISRRSKRQAAGESLECNDEGFFRHPRDCRSFYRCVKGATGLYDTHLFSCPDALVFDEEYATCNWPDKAAPCDTRRQFSRPTRAPEAIRAPVRPVQRTNSRPEAIRATVRPAQSATSRPKSDYFDTNSNLFTSSRTRSTPRPRYTTQSPVTDRQVCNSPGFFRHDRDCTKFYKCVQKGNYYVRYELSCPNNFAYDETTSRCVNQRYSNACSRRYTPYPPRQDDEESPSTTEAVSSSSQPPSESSDEIICEKEGYFRNPEDCNLFYRCVDFSHEGLEFVKYDFSCPEGLVFNEESSVCTWPDPTKPCDGSGGTGGGDRETGQDESNDTDNELNSEIPQETTTTTRRPASTRRPTTSRPTTESGRRSTTPSTTTQVTSAPDEGSSGPGEDPEQPDDSESESGCSQEGFFRNPEDCNKFYRCVDFRGTGQEYVRYDFACAEGLVFDEANSVCNWPSASAPCESSTGSDTDEDGSNRPDSTTSRPDTTSTRRSTQGGRTTTGRTRSTTPASTTQRGGGSTTSRPRSTITASTTIRTTQSGRGSTTSRPRQSTTTRRSNDRTTPSPTIEESDDSLNQNDGECKEAGFFRNPDDCNKFYRCVDYNGNGGEFVKYDFACPEGLTFDEKNSVCNWPDASEPCEGGFEDKDDSTTNINEASTSPPTQRSTTQRSTTQRSTTQRSTTQRSTTQRSTTQRSTTQRSTTQRSTTQRSTTQRSTTQRSTTQRSTTQRSTTQRSTTQRTTSIQTTPSPAQSTASTEDASRLTTSGDSENEGSTSEDSTNTAEKGNGECREAGFFRNPDDCGKFYRCVDFNGDGQEFVLYDFDCPDGLTFDEANSVCNWPEQSPPCDGSSTDENRGTSGTTQAPQTSQTGTSTTAEAAVSTTKSDEASSTTAGDSSECIEEGFFRNRDDCTKFYRCINETGNGQQFTRYDFQCPEGLIFDDQNKKCDFPSDTLSCNDSESTTAGIQTTTSSTTSAPGECTEEGYFRNPNDCSQYYRCIDEGDGTFTREDFSCAEDEVFDEEMRYCNRKDLAAPCDGSSTSAPVTTQTDGSTSTSRTECTESGFFRCPEDCNKFYRCVEEDGNSGNYIRYNFTCPEGLIFDERNKKCDFPSAELTCDNGTSTSDTTQSESTTTATSITSTTLSSSTTEGSPTTGDSAICTEEGYFRNPEDCSKYYRCIDEGDGTFTREDFSCADDEVFDEEMRYCNRKDLAPPCDESATSSQTQGTTQSDESTTSATDSSRSECTEPGFFRCPEDCNKFYRCVEEDGNSGNYIRYNFTCPEGLIFDERNKKCDFPSAVLTCDNERSTSDTTQSESTTTATSITSTTLSSSTTEGSPTIGDSAICTEEGYFRNPVDCSKYYRCIDEGDGTFTREDFSCADDEIFDEEMRYCNRKDLAPPCDESSTSSQTQGTTQSDESTTSATDSSRSECTEPGFFRCPEDCNKFFRCVADENNGGLIRYNFTCPEGLIFDENNKRCDFPSAELTCDNESSTTSSSSDATTASSGTTSSPECTEEGFFRNSNDCSKYYRCLDEGDGTLTKEDFSCAEDEVFDVEMRYCNRKDLAPPCDQASTEPGSSTTQSSTDAGSSAQTDSSDGTTQSNESTTNNPTDGTTRSGEQSGDCQEEGFHVDPQDCSKFHRCVDFEGNGQSYTKYDFECPEGLVFDETSDVCNWPSSVPSCESSGRDNSSTTDGSDNTSTTGDSSTSATDSTSTTTSSSTSDEGTTRSSDGTTSDTTSSGPSGDIDCTEEGFFRNPDDCTKFYRCVDFAGTRESYVRYDFECPQDLVFDEVNKVCNWASMTPACESGSRNDSRSTTVGDDTTTTDRSPTDSETSTTSASIITSDTTTQSPSTDSTTASSEGDFQCEEEGFFRDANNCKKYYECKRDEDSGELVKIDCECPDGHIFDMDGWYCNAEELSPPCNDGSFRCQEEGFFRDPEDCTRYYQCTRSENGSGFESERFECTDGNVFDEAGRYCNAPELSEPCENSTNSTGTTQNPTSSSATSDSGQTTPSGSFSTTPGSDQTGSTTSSSSDDQCTEEGFFRNSDDCTKYHQCTRNEDSGELERTDFACPDGRVFDEGANYCNDPDLSEQPCDNGQTTDGETTAQGGTTTTASSSTTTRPTTTGDRNRSGGGDIECTQEGFFRHPDDCNKFYRCVDFSGSGESYVRYDFDCPEGLHFDEVNSVCNWPTMTPRCSSGNF